MARKSLMPMPTKGRTAPKLIATLVIVASLAIIVKHPNEAASWANAIGRWLDSALDGLVSFVQQL
ncbi:hypothetical protein [Prauserella muralis]|uniref:Uncharacterized protein n=1 Tax=Prauserella muralis TaxID=588067 RepID=A0A2V4BAG2_9PSEU|nr:hypothetical protein [Prauserella muralis]PXY31099.1 hypothetical protein BAY60_01400 [Prauserella muralis]TWE14613.1 hypothetical protein FHX69_6770 [Prauserella muralis]